VCASFVATCVICAGVAIIAVEVVTGADVVDAIIRSCTGLAVIAGAPIWNESGHAFSQGLIAYDGFACAEGDLALAVVVCFTRSAHRIRSVGAILWNHRPIFAWGVSGVIDTG